MIITRRGMADADGKPKDVDREFVCLYLLFDEVGSSRVDLQACKLEYSIVSPK